MAAVSLLDGSVSPLTISLFGPFEVRLNGALLPRLRTRKGQWLLALLTLRDGREVARDWLAGLLWPDSPDSQGLASLRMSLADLRRALGEEAARLRSPTAHVLTLDLRGAAVDVIAFDEAVERGDAPSLERAVALYRGPLLEEWVEEWVLPERQAREEACLTALETLAAAALARGDPAAAERCLRRAVVLDPLRETAQRGLMQALASGGSKAAMIQVYRELRLRLHRDLNADPDPDTTALFQQLRVEARERASRSSLLHDPPSHTTLSPARSNLPAQTTPILGRQKEVGAVRTLLRCEDVRVVTLTGPGGVGKTRLGLQTAAELLDEFADGVFFIPLAPITDPALLIATIAQSVGVPETEGQPLLANLKEYLRDRQMLLLLDNFEQILGAAPVVAELLQAASRLKALVTSRAVLHLRGEHEFAVPPLELPDLRCLPPAEALSQVSSVALFIQRARTVRPEFMVTEGGARAVSEICHRLEGLPLAIELAAARIKLFPLPALLSRLAHPLRLLTGGPQDLPARQQTLRNTIAWSYELLNEGEKALFCRLSVFMGGFTLETAEAICSDDGRASGSEAIQNPKSKIQNLEVLDRIAALVDKSLLRREEPANGEIRFGMRETIREYALECLTATGAVEEARRRHAGLFLELAEAAEAERFGPSRRVWLERLQAEHDNLRAALGWAWERGAAETGLRLAAALLEFWLERGYRMEGREHLTRMLSLPQASRYSEARVKALNAAGRLNRVLGDYQAAYAVYEECLSIQEQLGDTRGISECYFHLGQVARDHGEYERARAYYDQMEAIDRELGQNQIDAHKLHQLGRLALLQGDLPTAERLLAQALAHLRVPKDHLDQRIASFLLVHLAEVKTALGDYPTAQALLDESLALCRKLEMKWALAYALHRHGRLAQQQGDWNAARSRFAESLTIWQQLGSKRGMAECFEACAGVAAAEGQHEHATRLSRAAQAIRDRGNSPHLPLDQANYERPVDALRAVLGEDRFGAAWAPGDAFKLEQAIRYALGVDSEERALGEAPSLSDTE